MHFFTNGIPSIREVIGSDHPLAAPLASKPRTGSKTLLRTVKLTGLLMLIACLQVSAKTNAQRLSISMKNGSLEKLFSEIEAQSNFVFTYDALLLKDAKPVNIELKDASVEEILEISFKNQPLDFSILNKTIFIKRKNKLSKEEDKSGPDNVPLNVPEISGSVTDENGEPLSGANIKLKNGNVVATTDAKGTFKLKNISTDAVLEITYTGYTPKTVQIGDKTSLKIAMSLATNKLDEAQVIAYGTTTARLNTGDVTTVTAKQIEQQPVSNVLAALEGRVPGLVVTQTTGLPGGGFTVQIRGQNSIINGNDPFFVIDGVPYNSEFPGGGGLINGVLQGGSPLNFINPGDIESVEILKDADATSIYGSRAANGAILITTKKGKAGPTKFDVNVYSGYSSPAHDLSFMNTQQYLGMRHEAFANDGATPNPNADYDLTFWDTARYTNWTKKLLDNPAYFSNGRVSVSGGNTNTQYLIGANYFRQKTGFPTLLPGDGIDQQGSAHFNITSFSTDRRFKVTFTGSYLSDQNRVQSTDFTSLRFLLPPDAPAIFNPDGSLNWDPITQGQAGTWSNPFSVLLEQYKGTTSNLVSNAILSYSPLTNLEIKGSVGYTNTQTNEVQTTPTTVNDPAYDVTSGYSNFNAMNSHSWIVEPQIYYKAFIGNGMLTTLLGTTFLDNSGSAQALQATGFNSDALLQDIQAATNVSVQGAASSEYRYNAFFGRVNYNWQDKYLLNITGRRDGSSRFGPGKQFANFGAIGLGWIFTKEDFIKNLLPFINFGKLRVSYGTTGNDQIGDYRFINLYQTTTYPYENIQGLYPSSLFNPNLAWEINKKLEGGIELGLWKDRVAIQASYYRNRSGNQLVNTPVSYVTGFGILPSNLPALVQNTGAEFVVNVTAIKTKNFNWQSSFNLSIPRNKLISFPNLASSPYSQRFIVGQPLSIQRVLKYIGVNDTTGVYEFSDSKGDPTYNPSYATDRNVLVNTNPKFYGGFQNSFTYKGFRLDFLFQFVQQTGQNVAASAPMPGSMYNQVTKFLNRWQKPGDKKPFQQFSQSYSSNAYNALSYATASSFIYSDASFIRLKNVAISWQLPEGWRRQMHLDNCRLYIQAQNLLTITNYFGFDPESQGNSLPPLRVLTAGLQVSL
jgi:TonB-dependent starch-binding outer membrane protein SusC